MNSERKDVRKCVPPAFPTRHPQTTSDHVFRVPSLYTLSSFRTGQQNRTSRQRQRPRGVAMKRREEILLGFLGEEKVRGVSGLSIPAAWTTVGRRCVGGR
jgi:hypothetical protein